VTTDTLIRSVRADFPGLVTADGRPWHYLDTAATAQKPQVVIDATVRAMGADYATVHRGVYARSADMTLAYEAARRKIAAFIGAPEHELVFTRGATEAINLVAHTWGNAHLRPATAFYSRCSSIIPISFRGSCCAIAPASRSTSARSHPTA
jgi:cysteine desulfurase/selenocysteine lyase